MFKHILAFALSALLFTQVCKAAEIDDAEAALSDLRQLTSKLLNAAIVQYDKLSAAVDMAALDTLEADADSAACVEMHSNMAIDGIYSSGMKLISMGLKMIYDDEATIIGCGRSDDQCLMGVTAEIQKETSELGVLLAEALENDSAEINGHIMMIQNCATKKN